MKRVFFTCSLLICTLENINNSFSILKKYSISNFEVLQSLFISAFYCITNNTDLSCAMSFKKSLSTFVLDFRYLNYIKCQLIKKNNNAVNVFVSHYSEWWLHVFYSFYYRKFHDTLLCVHWNTSITDDRITRKNEFHREYV